jgi:hypothetical protein
MFRTLPSSVSASAAAVVSLLPAAALAEAAVEALFPPQPARRLRLIALAIAAQRTLFFLMFISSSKF